MRKFLVIAADQEVLGAKPGPHTFKPAHKRLLESTVGKRARIVVATPQEAEEHNADAEVVAAFPMRMPDIAKLPTARWLHSFSAGVDKILSPEVAKSKVLLSSSKGVHATPIAEHIAAFALMFTRSMHKAARNQKAHAWKKDETLTELRGSNVLIVGLGSIGLEAARVLAAFGAYVSAIARSKKSKPKFVEKIGTTKDLDKMLPNADFVVLTLPHTEESHHLFDAAKFKRMKKSAVIINIGRGGIIHEHDLIEALKTGEIAGAGLDVTETEPLASSSPLWDMENVILTPHHSGLSHKYMDRAVELLCINIKAYLAKKPLPTAVDKKLGY
jgi:phosphoglycerate dehydrogenase-like enzyme